MPHALVPDPVPERLQTGRGVVLRGVVHDDDLVAVPALRENRLHGPHDHPGPIMSRDHHRYRWSRHDVRSLYFSMNRLSRIRSELRVIVTFSVATRDCTTAAEDRGAPSA